VAEAKALREIGVGTIAIMPNDTQAYREDSFDNMIAFAAKHHFSCLTSALIGQNGRIEQGGVSGSS
jgi:hypothetical protein